MVKAGDAVFCDSAAHASLVDGAKLADGALRAFAHSRPNSLRRGLRYGGPRPATAGVLVAVDGIYSMEGDWAPLAEIRALCDEYEARLLVDEAHALGVVGPAGRGHGGGHRGDGGPRHGHLFQISGQLRWLHRRPPGRHRLPAAVLPAHAVHRRQCAGLARGGAGGGQDRPTGRLAPREGGGIGPPPALGAGRARVTKSGRRPTAAIVPVHSGDVVGTGVLWRALLDRGVYTNCSLPPAAHRPMLRTSVMATHTEEQVDRALGAFEEIARHGIVDAGRERLTGLLTVELNGSRTS